MILSDVRLSAREQAVALFAGSTLFSLLRCSGSNWTLNALTKYLHRTLPKSVQHWIRDSGLGRSMANGSVSFMALCLFTAQPSLGRRFLAVHNSVRRLQYGATSGHFVEILPLEEPPAAPQDAFYGCLVFVHGGAWGSGQVWQYRLVAEGLARLLGARAVALVGYPVYPCSSALQQADAVRAALRFLATDLGALGVLRTAHACGPLVLAGHSSGGNIAALALMGATASEVREPAPEVSLFLGLAGVYDVEAHYLFEAARGVHLVSPMAGAAGHLPQHFWRCSPTLLAKLRHSNTEAETEESAVLLGSWPAGTRAVLVHGTADGTVPHSSSEQFAHALQALGADVHCSFIACDHVAPVLDMLFEAATPCKTAVLNAWRRFLEDSKK